MIVLNRKRDEETAANECRHTQKACKNEGSIYSYKFCIRILQRIALFTGTLNADGVYVREALE
jgi:hypothetical protein